MPRLFFFVAEVAALALRFVVECFTAAANSVAESAAASSARITLDHLTRIVRSQ